MARRSWYQDFLFLVFFSESEFVPALLLLDDESREFEQLSVHWICEILTSVLLSGSLDLFPTKFRAPYSHHLLVK